MRRHGRGDTFYSIENVSGSLHDDDITGNGDANTLRGSDGDDDLVWHGRRRHPGGRRRRGLLCTAAARSTSSTAATTTTNSRAAPGPTSCSAAKATTPPTTARRRRPSRCCSSTMWRSKGDAEGDTFSSIENLTGSNYDDLLGGNDSVNSIHGYGGQRHAEGIRRRRLPARRHPGRHDHRRPGYRYAVRRRTGGQIRLGLHRRDRARHRDRRRRSPTSTSPKATGSISAASTPTSMRPATRPSPSSARPRSPARRARSTTITTAATPTSRCRPACRRTSKA